MTRKISNWYLLFVFLVGVAFVILGLPLSTHLVGFLFTSVGLFGMGVALFEWIYN